MICMAMYGRKLLLCIKPLKATLKNYSLEEVGLGGAHLKIFVPHDDFITKKIFVLWILVFEFVWQKLNRLSSVNLHTHLSRSEGYYELGMYQR